MPYGDLSKNLLFSLKKLFSYLRCANTSLVARLPGLVSDGKIVKKILGRVNVIFLLTDFTPGGLVTEYTVSQNSPNPIALKISTFYSWAVGGRQERFLSCSASLTQRWVQLATVCANSNTQIQIHEYNTKKKNTKIQKYKIQNT